MLVAHIYETSPRIAADTFHYLYIVQGVPKFSSLASAITQEKELGRNMI
jgi:hypothetical protein